MKSPAELKLKLCRQWDSRALRESRLLENARDWPVVVSIGKPKPAVMRSDLSTVKRHVEAWRTVTVGEVVWERVQYRDTAEPVELPIQWRLHRPTDWIKACGDPRVRNEFESLTALVQQTEPCFHRLWVRRRSLWREKQIDEVLQAARLAMVLNPGSAKGRPLRTMSIAGIDTKFFERNAHLMTSLLDARFDDEVSRLGLEVFLGALVETDHWLLVVDLDGNLLPFRMQRVGSSELTAATIPGKRTLIIENESCHHHLPALPETIAVLGAGFDLGWTRNRNMKSSCVGYWGDIDTWGLQFLAQARANLPNLDALMMDTETFDSHQDAAVPEPVSAGNDCPEGLTTSEQTLYRRLLHEPRGRLEQEFLPPSTVHETLLQWVNST